MTIAVPETSTHSINQVALLQPANMFIRNISKKTEALVIIVKKSGKKIPFQKIFSVFVIVTKNLISIKLK